MSTSSHVAVIGTDIVENLLGDMDPIGKEIRVGGEDYTVIGVGKKQGKTLGQSRDNYVAIPITTYLKQFGSHISIRISGKANGVGTQPKEIRAKWLQLAQADMERASKLYEPILGFSNVSANLEKLRSDQQQQLELQAIDEKPATAKVRYASPYAARRWH